MDDVQSQQQQQRLMPPIGYEIILIRYTYIHIRLLNSYQTQLSQVIEWKSKSR